MAFVSTLRTITIRLLHAVFAVALLANVLAPFWWFAGLFSHFVPLYTLGVWLYAVLARDKARAVAIVAAILLTAWCAWPWVLPTVEQPTQRLVFYNSLYENTQPQQDAQAVLAQQADVVALAEQNSNDPRWGALANAYPHRCAADDFGAFSLWLGSKEPLQSCQIHELSGMVWLRATLNTGVAVYVLHPTPPLSAEMAELQTAYLDQVAQQVALETQPVLLVGDINATPFSLPYHRFVSAADLNATMRHATPTWWPGGLHLDHVLVRDIQARTKVLPQWNSDHNALLVEYKRAID